jgi:hypothetical protein
MGDSLQKRLEELERQRPSPVRTPEEIKPTWRDKLHFWKRKWFGKPQQVPQKESIVPDYEKTDPDWKAYHWQSDGTHYNKAWKEQIRAKRIAEEEAFAQTGTYAHRFLNKKNPFSEEEMPERIGPHWDTALRNLASYKDESQKRGLMSERTRKKFTDLIEPRLLAGIQRSEEEEHERLKTGERIYAGTVEAIGDKTRSAQGAGLLPEVDEKQHTAHARQRWAEAYLKNVPREKVGALREKHGAFVVHGLNYTIAGVEGYRPGSALWHEERIRLNNPELLKMEGGADYARKATPQGAYALMKEQRPMLSTSLVTAKSDPRRFYSPVGMILKEGDVYTARADDATTVPRAGIRLPRHHTTELQRGLREALSQAERAPAQIEASSHNELTVAHWKPAGFYIAENPRDEITRYVREDIAQLARKENLPLYLFEQGKGFQEVDPRQYLPGYRPERQLPSYDSPSTPSKPKTKRGTRTRKIVVTAGVVGVGVWLLLSGISVTGNVIGSVGTYTPSLFFLLALLGIVVLGALLYMKRRNKEELTLRAV